MDIEKFKKKFEKNLSREVNNLILKQEIKLCKVKALTANVKESVVEEIKDEPLIEETKDETKSKKDKKEKKTKPTQDLLFWQGLFIKQKQINKLSN